MAVIRYNTYRFNSPPIVQEHEFHILKEKFNSDPNSFPFPRGGFLQQFKGLILFYLIGGIICPILATTGIDALEIIGMIGLFILFFSLFSTVPELFSFVGFMWERNSYYKKLREDIIESEDYDDFKKLVNGSYENLHV